MIKHAFAKGNPVFSIEVFPPKKTDDIVSVYSVLEEFKKLNPSFISVTYGAGGATSGLTADIAAHIQQNCNIEALSHLTCASLPNEEALDHYLNQLRAGQVPNILALRGDEPKEMESAQFNARYYSHASDLTKAISDRGDFCIAGACYPEKHPEATTLAEDIEHIKNKVEQGVDFLITQLFYDNDVFLDYLEKLRRARVTVPVTAGLMPVTSVSQIKNIVSLSGAYLPMSLTSTIAKYSNSPDDLRKAGLEYTKKQMESLLSHGVDGIHLYSMNKVETAKFIFS